MIIQFQQFRLFFNAENADQNNTYMIVSSFITINFDRFPKLFSDSQKSPFIQYTTTFTIQI